MCLCTSTNAKSSKREKNVVQFPEVSSTNFTFTNHPTDIVRLCICVRVLVVICIFFYIWDVLLSIRFLFVSILLSIVFAHLRCGSVTISAIENVDVNQEKDSERESERAKESKNTLTTTTYSYVYVLCMHSIHFWCWFHIKWFKVNWLFSNICTTLFKGTKQRKWIYLFLDFWQQQTNKPSFVRMAKIFQKKSQHFCVQHSNNNNNNTKNIYDFMDVKNYLVFFSQVCMDFGVSG